MTNQRFSMIDLFDEGAATEGRPYSSGDGAKFTES
jgi:hypothetical protein